MSALPWLSDTDADLNQDPASMIPNLTFLSPTPNTSTVQHDIREYSDAAVFKDNGLDPKLDFTIYQLCYLRQAKKKITLCLSFPICKIELGTELMQCMKIGYPQTRRIMKLQMQRHRCQKGLCPHALT